MANKPTAEQVADALRCKTGARIVDCGKCMDAAAERVSEAFRFIFGGILPALSRCKHTIYNMYPPGMSWAGNSRLILAQLMPGEYEP